MSNPFTEDWFKLAKEYEDFVNLAKKAKSKQQLHPLVEKRLSIVLSCLYPNDFAVTEVCGIPGGRHDLMQFSFNGRRAVFEFFFSPSQVSQDLRLLERAAAEVKVAILIDTDIKSELAVEYVRKRPDHFPFLWLSDLMLYSQEEVCKEKLREIVDEDACINILRRILYSPAGNNYEPSLRRQLKRIEGVINSKKAENKKHQKPTGGEYIVFQIIAKICKMGIQKERLRSLDAWLQKNIKFAIMNVGYGLQVFLKTDLNGHHTISAAGDFADDLIINGEENDQAYIVICLNKIVNDFLEANGKERQPLQFHFYHTSQELIFEIFAAKELEKTNAKSGIDTP